MNDAGRIANSRILVQDVPLVRRLLTSNESPEVVVVGTLGEIQYLVNEQMTQANLSLLETLARSAPSPEGQRRLLQKHNALQPYCGQSLLKAGLVRISRNYEVYIDPGAEAVLHLAGFASLEARLEPPVDASTVDRARWIFDHPGIDSFADGQCAVELLLEGRDEAGLSSEELRLLAKGYNWWGRHASSFEVVRLGLIREPYSDEWLSIARVSLGNAYFQDLPRYLTACDTCIATGVGPVAFWHIAKADQFLEIATGERELEDYEWESGDPIRHPEFLRLAAESLAAALASQPGLPEDNAAQSWVGNWNERFAAVILEREFRHLAWQSSNLPSGPAC